MRLTFSRKARQEQETERQRAGVITAVLAAVSGAAAIYKVIAAFRASPKAQEVAEQAKSKAISFTRRKPTLATPAG